MRIEGPGKDAAAGTHAFIVGVSHYPFADGPQATRRGEESHIANLTTAAKSASDVADWLLSEYCNPDAPLASIRILLSPVDGENINPNVWAQMDRVLAPATRDSVKREFSAFRADCKENSKNMAFVYVAGHGVQLNKDGAIVLLHDFGVDGEDYLYGAIDMKGCHAAMNEAGNAHQQLWFSDACRETPIIARKFAKLSGAFKPGDEGLGDVDSSPLFLAASSRETAFATTGANTLLSEALLSALRSGAASGPDAALCDRWHVPLTKLVSFLPQEVDRLLAGRELQSVACTGRVREMVAQRFMTAPKVDIVIDLDPEGARSLSQAELLYGGDKPPLPVDNSWPLKYRGEPGLYELNVTVSPPPEKKYKKLFPAAPPGFRTHIEVG